MLEHCSVFRDVAGIFMVGLMGWVIVRFISRQLAWFASAVFSGIMLIILVIADLIQIPSAAHDIQMDMIYASVLCLVVHLISDFALTALNWHKARGLACATSDKDTRLFPQAGAIQTIF